jgi:aminobenzoyl-glutamate utilization protein B
MDSPSIIKWLEDRRNSFISMADEIWENPEIGLKEHKASQLQAKFLEEAGFAIKMRVGGLPTAFIAEWGCGGPIIGFIGEYDALSNSSQKREPYQEPHLPGGLGHACGHNLLGTGVLAAAAAVKQYLETNHKPGIVRYYGCPAEEILVGKVYMAREGVFNDLDAALNFHPGYLNKPSKGSMVALNNIKFHFYGKSSHAGAAPHLGRSALDAVELMNVGANYLREHVEEKTRIHYVITHGGDLPNIVPCEAEVWYFIRAPRRDGVDQVTDRIRKIAQGAAMMTDTTFREIFISGCYNVLNNSYLADLQYQVMQKIGPIQFNPEEKEFARIVNSGYPCDVHKSIFRSLKLPPELEGEPLFAENYPANDTGHFESGSTDVGDVSWITPLSMLDTACWASGASGHSWGIVATSGMSIGHKGMIHAAKILAVTAATLFTEPEHLSQARLEFMKATQDNPYHSPLPADVMLPE